MLGQHTPSSFAWSASDTKTSFWDGDIQSMRQHALRMNVLMPEPPCGSPPSTVETLEDLQQGAAEERDVLDGLSDEGSLILFHAAGFPRPGPCGLS